MAVITVSRQLGSLGCDIADAVAQRLGYRKVWRGLINQAARRARTPGMALAMLDDLGLLGLKPSLSEERAYLEAIRDLIEELARGGNVLIVGRGGQAVLRGWPETLHLRIIAPLEVRVERLVQRHGDYLRGRTIERRSVPVTAGGNASSNALIASTGTTRPYTAWCSILVRSILPGRSI